MNAIYTNSTSTNILNNNSNTITSLSNQQTTNENSNNTNISVTNNTDSVEITEKDASKINTKKANDAFQEVASEFTEKNGGSHIKLEFFVVSQMMKDSGINVPSFNLNDNTNSAGFLSFIDKMKDFVQNNNIIHNGAPMDKTEFFEFCDSYKEKLVKYDCK
jgi:hypothetical protein